jgi:hypothetical protein
VLGARASGPAVVAVAGGAASELQRCGSRMTTVAEFYDQLSGFYHLIYDDWEESIQRQASQLHSVIHETWGN